MAISIPHNYNTAGNNTNNYIYVGPSGNIYTVYTSPVSVLYEYTSPVSVLYDQNYTFAVTNGNPEFNTNDINYINENISSYLNDKLWEEIFGENRVNYSNPWFNIDISGRKTAITDIIYRSEISKILYYYDNKSHYNNFYAYSSEVINRCIIAELKDTNVIFVEHEAIYGNIPTVKRFISDDLEALLDHCLTKEKRKEMGL